MAKAKKPPVIGSAKLILKRPKGGTNTVSYADQGGRGGKTKGSKGGKTSDENYGGGGKTKSTTSRVAPSKKKGK